MQRLSFRPTPTTPLRRPRARASSLLLALAGGVALTLGSAPLMAQDPEPLQKEPNVLLIVDTSGSMEYKTGSSAFPSCDPTGTSTSERSRWIEVVEVLTGTVNDYRCQAVDRRSSTFASDFDLPGGVNPPDIDYRNPYHRPLSGSCAPWPNSAGLSTLGNAFDWVAPAFHPYNSTVSTCSFNQSGDGLIDSLNDSIRFGLMTFDTLPNSSRGHDGSYTPSWSAGADGAWSYYLSVAQGLPVGCTSFEDVEVGARNGAAPAWEGKLIHFGDPNASATANQARHDRLQSVLLSTRPYGATPIAGVLEDARAFLTQDGTPDPLDSTLDYGPKDDPFIQGGCRERAIVLLTDGEPNLDLRPHCEGSTGACPFDEPTSTVADMAAMAPPIRTHVVGFVPEVTASGVDCTAITTADFAPGGTCDAPSDEEVQVCCRLHEIAYEGDTEALFADDKTQLRNQLSTLFSSLATLNATATQPVRTPTLATRDNIGTDAVVAYRFLTSYNLRDGLWEANIERLRWTCPAGAPEEQAKDEALGDDFADNVEANASSRVFQTFIPTDPLKAGDTIRPNMSDGNGDGLDSATTGASVRGSASDLVSLTPAEALDPDVSAGSSCAGLSDAACAQRILQWVLGLDNGTGEHRCQSAGDPDCSLIGDVMHSTPVIVDRPGAAVDDETYEIYQTQQIERPMMMYTSSNDGFLHGFYVSPNDPADPVVDGTFNNEEFAFLPPAVLPELQSQYPGTRQKLLDGVPVVGEVVATTDSTNTYYPYKLERSVASAQNAASTWRTILVQSFGGARAGYFAVDVTEPEIPSTGSGGPTFLWQITTDEFGNPLFGKSSGQPIITTLDVAGVETAVAVLPGGHGTPTTGTCARSASSLYPNIETGFAPRGVVRCYEHDPTNDGVSGDDDPSSYGSRSLTIVRLDSGEVIRTFRRDPAEAPGLASANAGPYASGTNGRFGDQLPDLDSPITGVPAAFPTGAGAVADRVFVGDQDGGLWKIDVSNSAPAQWTMELFFDAFSRHPGLTGTSTSSTTTTAPDAEVGRPIATRPVLSFDQRGQITVAFATGDQDLSGSIGEEQYVWSLTEKVNDAATGFVTAVNWYQELLDGEHVLGDLELVNGTLFFSTYAPPLAAAACDGGESEVWGVDYLRPFDETDRSQGGRGALDIQGQATVRSRTAAQLGLSSSTLIFGVNIEFAPSCAAPISIPDAYLGGNRTMLQGANAPQMQLTFQTTNASTSKDSLGFQTAFESINLEPPRNPATIESWAAILE